MPIPVPTVPEYITVHLGEPSSNTENVRVLFSSYIKNVASSEVFPTWPQSAILANIYAQITFALNRLYNEHYRSFGYDFDITSSPAYDQTYVNDREIYGNIGALVDQVFNNYVVKGSQINPYFTQYCSGTNATCKGLSQWGTVGLAKAGYNSYQILQHYYGDNIGIVKNAPIKENVESYPGIPLRLGSAFENVYTIQKQLNRISENYPAIPKIPINKGVFDEATRSAVIKFQEIFNLIVDGVVGKATWYKIKFVYNSIKRVGELSSEGLSIADVQEVYKRAYIIGDRDLFVSVIQYYLNFISNFNNKIPPVKVDGIYGPLTANAVTAFQQAYGLKADGIVGRNTWNKLQQVYFGIIDSLPKEETTEPPQYYPGYFITPGSPPKIVKDMQTFLRVIGLNDPSIPLVTVNGMYDEKTLNAVKELQKQSGIIASGTGYVGPLMWNEIIKRYNAYKK